MTSVSVSDVKTWPSACEPLLDRQVVLDDAVVDHDEVRRSRRCGDGRSRRSGRPWVAQRVWPMPMRPSSGRSRRRPSSTLMRPAARRICSPAGAASTRHARGVVAAVLEPLEPFERRCRPRPCPRCIRRSRTWALLLRASGASCASACAPPSPRASSCRRARHRERAGRHVLGDHRAGRHVGALADRDGRHEARVGPDERAVADRPSRACRRRRSCT